MKVFVTTVAFSGNPILRNEVLAYFPEAQFNEYGKRLTKDELIGALKEVDAAIVGLDQLDREVLFQLPELKIIAKYGVGLDNIDLDVCNELGIEVGWTGGVNRRSVSEMALGFMLSLLRNLYYTSNKLKQGEWFKNGGTELSGKKVGIIGVGNIGRDLVKLLAPFHCDILANDIVDIQNYCESNEIKNASKDEIFESCDVITLHTPLNDSTYELINKKSITKMKSDAIVINTARGKIVSLTDLKHALISGKIAGAAIDVYDQEPPTDAELIGLDNLICTPHIGGNSKEAVLAMGRSAINHLVEYQGKFDPKKKME